MWRMWKYTHNHLERQEANSYSVAAFLLSSLSKGNDGSRVVSVSAWCDGKSPWTS